MFIFSRFLLLNLKVLLLLSAISSSFRAAAQTPTAGDCLGAFTVCQITYDQSASFVGEGNYPGEINPNAPGNCLTSGEKNNAWYMISVQNAGRFGFNINPKCPDADYDWALFDLTNATCSEIATNPSLLVACNFRGSTFPTATTGMNDGPNPQDEDMIDVSAGKIYALVVNNFSGLGQCGYELDFLINEGLPNETTADIIDDVPPTMLPNLSSPVNCGSTTVSFCYSEYVKCSSVRADGFRLITPAGDTINGTVVNGEACLQGGRMEKCFTVVLEEAVFEGGNYTFESFGQVEDLCGNVAPPASITFNLPAIQLGTSFTPVNCALNDGTATVNILVGGTAPFRYEWDTSPPQTGATASGLGLGTYNVKVTDNQGCFAETSVVVRDQFNLTVSVETESDICGSGVGKARAVVSGGTPFSPPSAPYQYLWTTGNPNNLDNISEIKTGAYQVTVTDAAGCNYTIDFFIPDFRESLNPDFRYSPDLDPIPGLYPSVKFLNFSEGATSYFWDFGTGEFSSSYEPEYEFPGSGSYIVSLVVENSTGCKDTLSRIINIGFLYTFYAPNAFSPNNDWVNDIFRLEITGIDTTTFNIVIQNRWGEEVFRTSSYGEGWLGRKFNTGDYCPSGVYVFRASFIDLSGKKHVIHGRVLLLG
jgi:gliding motility-associated-like protein